MSMLGGVECEICGGKEFYKEAGFYFCNECQTQTQELKEHAFEEFEANVTSKATKVVAKPKSNKSSEQAKLTSWECYNYVIKGLTDELINLGADPRIKYIVKRMWFQYLNQLEVINTEKPKLQAVNCKVDAEIIYNKKSSKKRKKKRSNKSSDDSDISSLDASSIRKERLKRKRALVKAQYEYFSSQQSEENKSLMNETLTSLRSSDTENSSEKSIPLNFNSYAKKELRRQQSKKHLQKHLVDFDSSLSCHKATYRNSSYRYRMGAHCISINKIYAILYLSLLMTRSPIHLGDILRFTREGHLSFNNYKHFFPEELSINILTKSLSKTMLLASKSMREVAFKMGNFLDVTDHIFLPNLMELIKRYCKELNLPDKIANRAIDILTISNPSMQIFNRLASLPNYEARAASLIIFQLKLLFGLDGVTEVALSNYAAILNKCSFIKNKMFDFTRWLQFLEYRKCTLMKHHLPTELLFTGQEMRNSDLFIQNAIRNFPEYDQLDTDRKYNKAADDCRLLLNRLKDYQTVTGENLHFPHSLTPFKDYNEVILHSQLLTSNENEILSNDFTGSSLDFLLNPNVYLPLVNKNEKVKVIHGGANKDIQLYKPANRKWEKNKVLRQGRKMTLVKVLRDAKALENNKIEIIDTDGEEHLAKDEKTRVYLELFKSSNKSSYSYNTSCNRHTARENPLNFDVDNTDLLQTEETYSRHYNPHERFWVNYYVGLEHICKKDFENFFATFPFNFQMIVKEFSRILEQTPQEILEDYVLTEVYLIYIVSYGSLSEVVNNDLSIETVKKMIRKAKLAW